MALNNMMAMHSIPREFAYAVAVGDSGRVEAASIIFSITNPVAR